MTSEYDVLVIGAGMAGASVAAELAADARVAVLEREEQPGYHATGRSAALYSAVYGNAAVRALTAASRAFYDRPPSGFCETPLLKPRGVFFCAAEGGRAALEQTAVEGGSLLRPVDREALLEKIPILKPQHAVAGLCEEGAADIDVAALLEAYLRRARHLGVQVRTGEEVLSIARTNGKWTIATRNGQLSASVLVNAAGAWADEIATRAGVTPLGLAPMRRTAMLLEAPQSQDVRHWPCVIDAQEQFYFKPDAGRLLLSPADETPSAPCDAQPEEIDVAIAIDRFEQATTMRVSRPLHRWAGLRTFSLDRTPVIGFDVAHEGFFWLAGQGGYGIQTAPGAAALAAALVTGTRRPVRDAVDENLFSPSRFARGPG
jgi:D-arginine dehydrogenase